MLRRSEENDWMRSKSEKGNSQLGFSWGSVTDFGRDSSLVVNLKTKQKSKSCNIQPDQMRALVVVLCGVVFVRSLNAAK